MSTSDENLKVNLDSETPTNEVAQLQEDGTSNNDARKTVEDERIAKLPFHCVACEIHEMVHYFGKKPPFVYGIEFHEPTYVMRDPYQAPLASWKSKAEYFVALGAHCRSCDDIVCKDNECSFYYKGTYCLQCARKCASTFPLDVQQKLRKLT